MVPRRGRKVAAAGESSALDGTLGCSLNMNVDFQRGAFQHFVRLPLLPHQSKRNNFIRLNQGKCHIIKGKGFPFTQ